MSGYGFFARYYDELTANIDYSQKAKFFTELIQKHMPQANLLLDLACGTGSLSFALSALGQEVIGVDASDEMLSVAMQKGYDLELEKRPIFLRQSMDKLDLYGTIDATICGLDSVNHMADEKQLLAAFKKVALFTNPSGLFIFDVNTLHKHRDILGNNAFVYDLPNFFCSWQNEIFEESGRVDISLDFFAKCSDGRYKRESESFSEYFYSDDFLLGLLDKAGFEHLQTLADDTSEGGEAQRLIYVAQKR